MLGPQQDPEKEGLNTAIVSYASNIPEPDVCNCLGLHIYAKVYMGLLGLLPGLQIG